MDGEEIVTNWEHLATSHKERNASLVIRALNAFEKNLDSELDEIDYMIEMRDATI